MNCDVCGEKITGKPARVIIETAKLVVCSRCATLGRPYHEPSPRRIERHVAAAYSPSRPARPVSPQALEQLDVVEGYATRIREARERMGLSQQDLATRVKERLSIIQKVESGKIAPDVKLCRELEHSLRIVLLTPRVEVPESTGTIAARSLTLGDIARVKRRDQNP